MKLNLHETKIISNLKVFYLMQYSWKNKHLLLEFDGLYN